MIRPRCAPGEGVCIFVLHWQMSDFNKEMIQAPREKIQQNSAGLIFKQSMNSMNQKRDTLLFINPGFFEIFYSCVLLIFFGDKRSLCEGKSNYPGKKWLTCERGPFRNKTTTPHPGHSQESGADFFDAKKNLTSKIRGVNLWARSLLLTFSDENLL